MLCANCSSQVENERLEILPDTKVCSNCANKYKRTERPKGIMVWGHKTAGEIQIVSHENFREYRRHNPYGRHTGRGSGIHRVTKATEYI